MRDSSHFGMTSCWILSLALVANNNNARVTSFVPSSLLLVRKSPNYANLFSTVEAVDKDSSVDTEASSDKLPILFPSLAAPLNVLGFSSPTPIQSASAKRALELENLLLIAPTGSGKTLSYMLPALEKIVLKQKQQEDTVGVLQGGGGGTVLVVAPTRELALQLMRDTTSILSNLNNDNDDSSSSDMEILLAVQGVQMPSTEELNGATVLIGTPKELVYVLA